MHRHESIHLALMHTPSINLVRRTDSLSNRRCYVIADFVVEGVLRLKFIHTKFWGVDVGVVEIFGGGFRVRRDGESA